MSSTVILKTCLDIIHYSGGAAISRPLLAGRGVVFCLHHVVPGGGLQRGFAPNAKLEITPEFLAALIMLVKRLGYECLSVDEAVERLKSGRKSPRFAVFTLDDGYKDNQLHAFPVFKRLNCPFTIYVSPRIAEGSCELWWRGLEALIAGNSQLDFVLAGQHLHLQTTSEKQKWHAWRKLFPRVQQLPELEQRQWIRKACEANGIDLDAMCRAAAMTWDEIAEINKDPLTTIGAHTLNHHNLLRLEADAAAREIVDSGQRIAEVLGEPTRHFAYPYGNVDAAGPREFEICARAGYVSSVTTRLGTVLDGHAHHLQALPRVMVSGRFQEPRHVEALISGLPPLLFNRGRRLLVE